MAADQGLVDSVANSNTKTIAEAAAWATAQVFATYAQSVLDDSAHRARLKILAEKFMSTSVKGADEVDPEQAAATLKLLTGNDLATTLSALGTAIAQIQQIVKTAQTTPPATAG